MKGGGTSTPSSSSDERAASERNGGNGGNGGGAEEEEEGDDEGNQHEVTEVYGSFILSDLNTTSIKHRDDNGSGNTIPIIRSMKDCRKMPAEFRKDFEIKDNLLYQGRSWKHKENGVNKQGQVKFKRIRLFLMGSRKWAVENGDTIFDGHFRLSHSLRLSKIDFVENPFSTWLKIVPKCREYSLFSTNPHPFSAKLKIVPVMLQEKTNISSHHMAS
jgi:hypothetical protein